MHRPLSYIALMVYAITALATQPNIGWDVRAEVEETTLELEDGLLIYTGLVSVTPLAATASSPDCSTREVVYAKNIETFDEPQRITFNITEPLKDVLVHIGLEENSDVEEYRTVDSQGLVLVKDIQEGIWVAETIYGYDDKINKAITEELLGFKPDKLIESDPLIGDPRRKNCPEHMNLTLPDIPKPISPCQESNGRLDPVDPNDSMHPEDPSTDENLQIPSPLPCGKDSGYPHKAYKGRCVSQNRCRNDDCDKAKEHHNGHHRRQIPNLTAYVRSKITFLDRNDEYLPLRNLICYVKADIYTNGRKSGTIGSFTTTTCDGQVQFRFDIEPGQSVHVRTIYTYLATGSCWIVSGNENLSQNWGIKIIKVDLDTEEWTVSAERVLQVDLQYPRSPYNAATMAADAYTTIVDYYRNSVFPSGKDLKIVKVRYPGQDGSAFFQAVTNGSSWINLRTDDVYSPTVMAHEYGHFAHWIGRNKTYFSGGGDHYVCNGNSSSSVAFSEGYATAFGMAAVAKTGLAERRFPYATYTQRLAGEDFWHFNVEDVDCGDLFMKNQEWRIAATLFDLVDSHKDEFDPDEKARGFIDDDFDARSFALSLSSSFIFYDLLAKNPSDIEQYWYVKYASHVSYKD
ncbi:hypothetical protein NW766_001720 [Fusarium irregulare]|uniref:Uncharacterized protein n=1 Tax=Fusarium irregulare TaxID=2494466 RepID=A0A9W8PYS7_9HYPO|nr:hypothetical protein NW766_001720 [Fusarium irregulare]